jgi:ParB family chromosome partitioning protein
MSQKRGLGRGISALIGDPVLPGSEGGQEQRCVPIDELRTSHLQPRTHFDFDELRALAESIRQQGLLQPILVRPAIAGADVRFEIVAGERRWRAAQLASLHEVPVVVRELSDKEAVEIALVENLQRAELGAMEEATAYRLLQDEFGLSQAEIGEAIGKSRSHVANMMRLLDLPEPVRQLVEGQRLSAGHARTLLGANDPEELARVVVEGNLSVRETEALTRGECQVRRRAAEPPADAAGEPLVSDREIVTLIDRLTESLGLKIDIALRGDKGRLVVHFMSRDQLEDVADRLETPGSGQGPTA